MDGQQFDQIVKALATGQSRRTLVKVMGGGVAAGLLAVLGAGGAEAAPCKKPDFRCGKGKNAQCCTGEQICQDGGCVTPCVPDCTGKCGGVSDGCTGTCDAPCPCEPNLGAACDDAGQCCPDGAAVACGPVGNLGQDQCCRPLGAACATPGDFQECCAVVFEPGVSGTLVTCAPGGTCGGPGAICFGGGDECASGVCCGFGIDGRCCDVGQRCSAGQCVVGS